MAKRTFRRAWGDEDGGAMVEFAILTTILVPTIMYAIFFYEVSTARLKAQEAARYAVWEMTVMKLSNWHANGQGDHDAQFNNVKATVMNEVIARWGDDLQSASPTFTAGKKQGPPITIDVTVDQNDQALNNEDAKLLDMTLAGGINTGPVNKGIEEVLGFLKFNNKGKITGTFKMKVKYKLMQRWYAFRYKEKMVEQSDMVLSEKQSILADQWDLKTSGDETSKLLIANVGNCAGSEYCDHVHKMAFLGLADKVNGISSALNKVGGLIDLHIGTDSVLISKPLTGYSGESTITQQISEFDGHTPYKTFNTNVFKDRWPSTRSPYTKFYKKTGQYYMGCKQPQKQDGECQYQ